jgi:hypothetical protein
MIDPLVVIKTIKNYYNGENYSSFTSIVLTLSREEVGEWQETKRTETGTQVIKT